MDWIKRLKCELPRLKSGFSVICAGVGALFSLIFLVACGNFYIYKLLLLPRHAPPPILFFLLFFLCGALVGCAVGTICSFGKWSRAVLPLLFLLLSFFFLCLWYVALFKSLSFFFALFLLLMALLMAALSLKESLSLGAVPSLLIGALALPMLFYLWMTFAILILN